MHSHERYYYNRLSQIFLNTSLLSLNLYPHPSLYLFLSFFYSYISFIFILLSLYLHSYLPVVSRKEGGGRKRERKRVGLADLVLAIRGWSAPVREGRGEEGGTSVLRA